MRERPILFSGPMMRAILDKRKTQTRRPVKPQPVAVANGTTMPWDGDPEDLFRLLEKIGRTCPYGAPGDRLWLRETWAALTPGSYEDSPRPAPGDVMRYRASEPDYDAHTRGHRWRPSIHMPRWASRITLEVTAVRVERLQEISEADARAEGSDCLISDNTTEADRSLLDLPLYENGSPYRNGFALLWESINGDGSWDANPWVWVVDFTRTQP